MYVYIYWQIREVATDVLADPGSSHGYVCVYIYWQIQEVATDVLADPGGSQGCVRIISTGSCTR